MLARPLVVGRYAIYDKIASGGMASVHFGRLTAAAGFTRTVAVKRLHPHLMEDADFLKTMFDEARLAARISHPNVVPTIDVVATETDLLVVMEYVRGESLARLLRALADLGQKLPLPIASAIAVGALEGLHAAHEATSDRGTPLGIVHRDVSPQNILVGIDGAPRIIDFGVAKAAGRLQTTREGVVKGKIPYMAPEQLGGHPVTPRADVYALAVVLWEMITGRKLFPGDVQATLLGQVLAGAHVPPSRHAPNLPEGLDGLVMKSLRVDPDARFASAREMAEALVRLVPPSLPGEVGEWVRQVAQESLARRGALLAEIESDSGAVPTEQEEEALGGIPRIRRGPTGQGEGAREDVGTEVSSVAQVPPAETIGSRSRSVRVGLAAALVAVVAVTGAAALVRRFDRPASNSAQPAPTPPISATAASSETAPPSSAAVAPIASPTASTSAPPLHPSRPTSTAGRAPAPAAPSAARNCTPNFYYDSAGQTRFKPECFH